MTENDIAKAVALAVATANAESARIAAIAKAEADEKAKKVTAGTVVGAFLLGMFPIIGGITGLVYLGQGKTAKGLLFGGMAVGWFFLAILVSVASN